MTDLQIAIDAIKAKLPDFKRYTDYYDGRHPMVFASEKFSTTFGRTLESMRDNLCPIVVDAAADRMEVINFAGDDKRSPITDKAWEVWQREAMEIVSHDTHREALKTGVGYLIVWAVDGLAQFYVQDPRQCVVIEDEDTGVPMFGAKQWHSTDKHIYVTLYYANRIEKYQSQKRIDGQQDALKDTSFTQTEVLPNPYGVIPMFRFEAEPVLANAIPIQDALNKTICDKLVAMEFAAFPQRWAVGLEPPRNEITGMQELPFKAGVDRLWFANDAAVKFGEFTSASLEPFLKVADSYRLEMARVSGTPLHFFSINTSDAISGEALKTLESRFTKRVKRLSLNFGRVWAEVMRFALQIEGQSVSKDNLTTQWESPEQRSEKEFIETLLMKLDLGVPEDTLLEEYGYTIEDIAKFNASAEPPSGETNEPQRMAKEAPSAERDTGSAEARKAGQ